MESYIDSPLDPETIQTPVKLLLALYWLIPLSWAVVLVDIFILKSALQKILPRSPEDLAMFTIFFNIPHIIASSLTFFDAEYIIHYKKRLLIPSILIFTLTPILPQIIGFHLFITIFLIWTIIHVIGQQFGLCIMMTGIKNKDYFIWKCSGLAIAIFVYLDLMLYINDRFFLSNFIFYTSVIMFIPFTITTIRYSSKSKVRIGTMAVFANYALVFSAWAFHDIKYFFFSILAPRIIHDATAFIFYITHDKNRNAERFNNFLYRPLAMLGIPILILGPLLAISCSFIYNQYRGLQWSEILFITLAVFHYYTESFTWKKGSLHRQAIFIH